MACIIQAIYEKGIQVGLSRDNKEVSEYIYESLGFKHYWTEGHNHVEALDADNIFNLWRIIDSEKDLYAKNVESYLKRKFFNGKDLSFKRHKCLPYRSILQCFRSRTGKWQCVLTNQIRSRKTNFTRRNFRLRYRNSQLNQK